MSTQEPFDPLIRFAEIERLVSKIYFRFSHLFFSKPKLRDFWWEMAKEEEQHACILNACRALIENYDDEKLEELWRFNVGTPLKGAPVTYSIGPKQYLAVQSSGRHLHPVKYDRLQHSSYLFVFALN